jgi:hypothetical protein
MLVPKAGVTRDRPWAVWLFRASWFDALWCAVGVPQKSNATLRWGVAERSSSSWRTQRSY